MNLNSWNYISQVVNLLMDFLFTSTNDPQSHSAALLWHNIKKVHNDPGHMLYKIRWTAWCYYFALWSHDPQVMCAIDYSLNQDSQGIGVFFTRNE